MNSFSQHTKKIHSGFTISDSYFEAFENQLFEKIKTQKEVNKRIVRKQKYIWMSSVAAVLLLSFGFFYFNSMSNQNTLNPEHMEHYIISHSGLSTYSIGEHLTDHDLDDLQYDIEINSDEIESYFDSQTQTEIENLLY